MVTANDRVTRILKIALVSSKDSQIVKDAVVKLLYEFKPILKIITSYNGKEFAQHQQIAKELEIDFYFARPYYSRERGANENMNGSISHYFPKGTNFETITNDQVKAAENKLNNRTRKRFGFTSPNQIYLYHLTNLEKVAFMT